jgi:uncharacterized RDD family membrane protein YckC
MSTTSADEAVLGLDNVRLELPIAGPATRALAVFVDYLVVGVLSAILVVVAIVASAGLADVRWWIVALTILGLFVIDYGYFAGMEVATGGRTLGKMALDLVVLDRRGGRASRSALLIRNCVRTADLLVGVPLMAADPLSRRLGDRLAGTVVAHARPVDAGEFMLRRIPSGWGAEHVAVLEDFLRRCRDLEPDRAQGIARRLLALIERDDPALLAGAPATGDAVAALKRAVEASA